LSEFWKRFFAGFVFIVLVLASTIVSHTTYTIFFGIVILLGSVELSQLYLKMGWSTSRFFNSLLSVSFFIVSHGVATDTLPVTAFLVYIPTSFLALTLLILFTKLNGFQVLSSALLSVVYLAIPFSLLHFLLYDITPPEIAGYAPGLVVLLFFMIWFNDSWAYIFGRWLGKHKLFPSISPKKTWEGFIGGTLITLAFSFVVSLYYKEYSTQDILIMGFLMATMGSVGDLVQSKLKRTAGVKDSGNVIPGHGGLLDRFDAFLFAIPFIACYLFLMYY